MNGPSIKLSGLEMEYPPASGQFKSALYQLTNFFKRKNRDAAREIQAGLHGVSIAVSCGERVGLIGHNGAGKTTLLKVMAGIYKPTDGEMEIEGKVKALFDLSLGFEPDASGRTNILYRGLLLGLAPEVISALTEEIIEFADLGPSIEHPVKTYSAGMLVRLAFAITTATRAEILLLDEIVAAGDASFLEKARNRLDSLVEGASILVLATHDAAAMRAICSRGVVLEAGRIAYDGPIDEALSYYSQA